MWRSVWLAVSLALLAGARAEPSLYKRVASCIAQTTRQNVASITNRGVNIAQATSPEPLRTGEYYLASFSPGIGCMLFSVVAQPPPPDGMDQQDYQPYLPGPIVAVSSRAVGVSTDGFTCKFKKTDAVFTPAAVSYMSKNAQDPTAYQNNNTVPLYSLPNTLSSLAGKVRCSYMLFRKTGYSYTAIPRCDPSVDNCTIPGSIDIGSMQWQFDKDHKPKQSVVVGGTLVVTCGVNKALWNNNETILLAAPNGGACFPSWARVETPRGPKSMADLAVGEKVLAVNPTTGKAVYDDVYLVPHRDAEASTMFLNIHVAPVGADGSSPAGSAARVLTLSPLHYVPAACGAERQQQCLKHARDVATGDFVWLVEGQQAVLAQVKQVSCSNCLTIDCVHSGVPVWCVCLPVPLQQAILPHATP